jgi:molybdopterin-guanine dinucleotide biosynthesis protein A
MDGLDKSRLVVEGRAIIVRQLDVLRRLTPEVFLVANDAERCPDLGVPVLPDALPGAGARGGLYSALISARADWIVVVACDMPFVAATALQQLVAEATTSGEDGAWARSDRGVEPLFACYRAAAAPRLRTVIEAGERRLAAAGSTLRMREVAIDARVLTDIDTPEDYARVQ